MKREILVDSCIYISLLNQGMDPAIALMRNANIVDLCVCGMVRMEVIRGIKNPEARPRMEDFMNVMRNIPTDNLLWSEATELGWKLARQGIQLPNQDILIAAHAQRAGAAVLTTDKHFSLIPGIPVFRNIDDI